MKAKRIISMLLSAIMVIAILPIQTFAASPAVTTGDLTLYTYGKGTASFSLTKDGGYVVTDCGVRYGTSSSSLTKDASYGPTGKGTFEVDLSGLSAGTTYYYQAYAVNANNEWAYGTVKSAVLPGEFNITSPSNNSEFSSGSSVTVKWSAAKSAAQYQLVMKDITAGETSSKAIYTGTSTSYTISSSSLVSGHEYKVQVKARSTSGSDTNSRYAVNGDDYYFYISETAKPGSFNITSPARGSAFNRNSSVTVKWSTAQNAVEYVLFMRDLSGGSSHTLYTGSNTSYTIDSDWFEGGHEYKIHVKARIKKGSDDGITWSSNSDEDNIYTFYFKLDKPVITSPSNNGTMSLSSFIHWNEVPECEGYTLFLRDNVTGKELLGDTGYMNLSRVEISCGLANITCGDFSTNQLIENRSYTLTLRARGEKRGYYTESDPVTFTLKGDIPEFTNCYSEHITSNSFDVSATVITTANYPLSSISDCGFYYRKSGSSTTQKISLGKQSKNQFHTTISGLSANTTYQFKAYAVNECGEGTSSWHDVTTSSVVASAPVVQTVGHTRNSDSEYVIKGKITDNGNTDITMYGFYYSTDKNNLSNPLNPYWETNIAENKEYTFTLSGLAPNTTYYYQAFAYNKYGIGEGAISSFTTGNYVLPEVISATISNSIGTVGETYDFTVKTNKQASKIIMYTESGAVADEWSRSSYYTDIGNERIWTISREIYSVGTRFLTFKASDGNSVNNNSSATVRIQITSAGEKIKATITSAKNVNLTLGASYTATWTTDKDAQSYNLFIYYNGNLIRTIKNYKYKYYDLSAGMLSNQGKYAIEVIPYYPGYEATGDSAEITVNNSTNSQATINSVNSTSQVVCMEDNFVCSVITNTKANKVVLETETGYSFTLDLKSSDSSQKKWELSRKLDSIGKRTFAVKAYDSNGKETSPSLINVDVVPCTINWKLDYNSSNGELSLSTTDSGIASRLAGAYAKIVVYKKGTTTDITGNDFNSKTIVKIDASGAKASRTWNVYTDLGLNTDTTYTFGVAYISSYANKYNCGSIIEILGDKTLAETDEELPMIYSVDMDVEESNIKLMSTSNSNTTVTTTLGSYADFNVYTNLSANELYMVDPNYIGDKTRYIKLSPVYVSLVNGNKCWNIRHCFTSIHANRTFSFVAKDASGKYSNFCSADKTVTVALNGGWRGEINNEYEGRRYLTIVQDNLYKDYNNNNKYYLWIKDKENKLLYYWNTTPEYQLVSQKADGCITKVWDIENELTRLSSHTTYIYGVSGKSNYCDGNNVSTSDFTLGEFTTGEMQNTNIYSKKYTQENIYAYRGPNDSDNNRAVDKNGQIIELQMNTLLECDDTGSYAENLKENWIKIKCENYINGVKYNTAYVEKSKLGDNMKFIWPLPDFTKITSQYGMRMHPTLHVYKKHTGIDIAGSGCNGKPIVASAGGTAKVCYSGGYGNYIIIEHINGFSTLYAHMSKTNVNDGENVKAGQTIGFVGQTGYATGPHLHFEVRKNNIDTDPFPYVEKDYNFIKGKKAKISLMSMKSIIVYRINCYNKYDELICEINSDDGNTDSISIPYSTEYIQISAYSDDINDKILINYNGNNVVCGENIMLSKSDINTFEITHISDEEQEKSYYSLTLDYAQPKLEKSLTSLLILDNERESGGDIPAYNVEIKDNMEITLPKSINEVGLEALTDNEYASVRVYKNGYYWIDKSSILLDNTDNELTIIVESEIGEEKEYTLTIKKASEYESDKELSALYLSAFDENDEYIDTYEYNTTSFTIENIGQNVAYVIPSAELSSDFASVKFYLNGDEITSEDKISTNSGFELIARVTAEDGTYKGYVYTYGEVQKPISKTTFKNTETYHKFYVTFEEAMDGATIYAAVYDKDSRLIGLVTAPCDGDDYYIINVPFNQETKKAKIFVWKENMQPFGVAETLRME